MHLCKFRFECVLHQVLDPTQHTYGQSIGCSDPNLACLRVLLQAGVYSSLTPRQTNVGIVLVYFKNAK